MFTSWKLGPALAAGNTVVLKPSELTPLSTLRIAELMAEAGFPDGVVNVVPGYGHTAGQRLAEHPDVGKIAFTGSTATGRRIVEASQGNLKRVQLELGGKGANIVFDDANLDAAVNGAAWAIFHNQGQACIAGSRLMLHEKIADSFLERFLALANSIRLGDPRSPETEMGPLTSAQHRDKVLSYVGIAAEQGARVLAGGTAPGGDLSAGYYVRPTVVEASPRDRVAQKKYSAIRHGAALWQRRRGAGHCQRDRLRPGQRPVDARPGARPQAGGLHPCGHVLDQLLQTGQSRQPLRRRGPIGLRTRNGLRSHA